MKESHLRARSIDYDISILKPITSGSFSLIIDLYTENGILNNVFEPSFLVKVVLHYFKTKTVKIQISYSTILSYFKYVYNIVLRKLKMQK